MRYTALVLVALAMSHLPIAQGNCSDGSTGVIISISHTEISQDGSQFMACFSLEGDPSVLFSSMSASVVYDADGIHPDFDLPTIPSGSPFPDAGYETGVGYCLGGPHLCPYYVLEIYRPGQLPPFIHLPAQAVEFACVLHDIQDPSETAGLDVVQVITLDDELNSIPSCPDEDQGYYDGPLPVELTSFNAVVLGSSVNLEWTTTSETNNAGFEVQVQRGQEWDVLGFVEGHGTTTEAQSYDFSASNLGVGTHVFRLKQIDFDGVFEYHGTVEATITVPGTHYLSSAYPNPFNPQSQFSLVAPVDQNVTAELYTALGQRVATLFEGSISANQAQTITIDGAGLPSGMYLVRVTGEHFADAMQVTLVK